MPEILGLPMSQYTTKEVMALCQHWLHEPRAQAAKMIFTPNPEIAVYAQRHPDFKRIVQSADLLLPDGMGIYLAGRRDFKERVTGVDLMMKLLAAAHERGIAVGFILRRGGLSTPADVTAAVGQRYSQLRYQVLYADEVTPDLSADLVCVGLGFPKQEQWCVHQRSRLFKVKLLLAIGGSIDYLTGRQTRAPRFLRVVGLEWLWRLVTQPSRFKRIYTATVIFPWLVVKDRYGRNRHTKN